MRARLPQLLSRVLFSGALVAALVAAPLPAADAALVQWQVSPGVLFSAYDTVTGAGPQRVYVLDIDPRVPGVSLDYASNTFLRDRAQVPAMMAVDTAAVAGVNGNFFDISDTGAPLGVGRARAHRVLHAPAVGWNNAFYQGTDGAYHVGQLHLVATIAQHPGWEVGALNTPNVKPDSISVYNHYWGRNAGMSVINAPGRSIVGRAGSGPGRTADVAPKSVQVREVHVKKGVVTSSSTVLHQGGYIHGKMLVGQGAGARELAHLGVGTPLDVSWALDQKPLMAITGNQVMLRAGKVTTTPDGQNAPRTTVGLANNGHIMIVAADGRQSFATGYSMDGMAALLLGLGVTDAINLDGGGSTTVVSRSADGLSTGVVNSPSAGHPRWVADALVVDYLPPPPA